MNSKPQPTDRGDNTRVSLERIYPMHMDRDNANDRDSIEIHEARYRFAANQLRGQHILDIACGCGFGTALMAAQHPQRQFIGVDIDPAAIDYARQHYQRDNITFVNANAMAFTGAFDTIVSLETIEHLPSPIQFIARLPTLLNPAGCIIASVPITPTCDGNPHHLHDFSKRSFYNLFRKQAFMPREVFIQRQPWVYDDAFSNKSDSQSRAKGVGNNVLAYYRRHPWALVTRVVSLSLHGACNLYLTAVFNRDS